MSPKKSSAFKDLPYLQKGLLPVGQFAAQLFIPNLAENFPENRPRFKVEVSDKIVACDQRRQSHLPREFLSVNPVDFPVERGEGLLYSSRLFRPFSCETVGHGQQEETGKLFLQLLGQPQTGSFTYLLLAVNVIKMEGPHMAADEIAYQGSFSSAPSVLSGNLLKKGGASPIMIIESDPAFSFAPGLRFAAVMQESRPLEQYLFSGPPKGNHRRTDFREKIWPARPAPLPGVGG